MLERLIASGSDDPFVWYGRALELRSQGRLDDAVTALADVANRYPDYVPTFLMGGQVAQSLGRPGEARKWLEQGLSVASAADDTHTVAELEAALAALDSDQD